jgi:hypothetical protein
MSVADRMARSIPADYSEDPSLSPEQVRAYHRKREAFWVDRIQTLAPSDTHCILVCGRDHLDGVATLLETGGHATERIDIRAIGGFDLGWVKNVPAA